MKCYNLLQPKQVLIFKKLHNLMPRQASENTKISGRVDGDEPSAERT